MNGDSSGAAKRISCLSPRRLALIFCRHSNSIPEGLERILLAKSLAQQGTRHNCLGSFDQGTEGMQHPSPDHHGQESITVEIRIAHRALHQMHTTRRHYT